MRFPGWRSQVPFVGTTTAELDDEFVPGASELRGSAVEHHVRFGIERGHQAGIVANEARQRPQGVVGVGGIHVADARQERHREVGLADRGGDDSEKSGGHRRAASRHHVLGEQMGQLGLNVTGAGDELLVGVRAQITA